MKTKDINAKPLPQFEEETKEGLAFFSRDIVVINQDMVQLKGVERKQKKLHFVYEGRLSTSGIKKIKASRGYKCEACDMTFKGRYPGLDDEFIECHHKIPYSYLREHEERSMKPSDFLILCPNCHAMIHRLDDPGDLDMLKEILKEGEK